MLLVHTIEMVSLTIVNVLMDSLKWIKLPVLVVMMNVDLVLTHLGVWLVLLPIIEEVLLYVNVMLVSTKMELEIVNNVIINVLLVTLILQYVDNVQMILIDTKLEPVNVNLGLLKTLLNKNVFFLILVMLNVEIVKIMIIQPVLLVLLEIIID